MKNCKTNRIISMVLVLAITLSILPINLATTVMAEESNPAAVQALEKQVNGSVKDEEQVTVIVQLKEEKVSSQSLKSVSGKKNKMDNSKEKKETVKDKIKDKGINVKVENEYSLLINGFSGKTSYEEAKRIANMPEVASVELAVEYDAPTPVDEVKMTNSVDLIKARQSWDLGFKGEGKLIAVLDSGADPEHQDFKVTNPAKAKYPTLESMQQAITTLGLPGKVFNNKVIYGYNYKDINQEIKEIKQLSGMHGMHVAGTTAANGQIKGVAPEAQLLIMRVFSENGGGTSSSVYLKAIEDAVALGADSVNMSLGSPAGTIAKVGQAVIDAIKKAADIGCLVNIAAGNESQFGYGVANPLADAPDFGIVGTPSIAPLSISVASINNNYVHMPVIKLEDGTEIGYKMSGKIMPTYNTFYDIVHVGIGRPEDFAGKEVRGKVALIERGGNYFSEKMKNAEDNGAIAVIIYNSEAGGEAFVGMSIDQATIPGCSIYRSEGLKLITKPQKVSFTNVIKPVPSFSAGIMSDFSNWGISNEQDFKPELTAPGGNIYSTLNDNTYGDMSGTSMATPHVTGGVALVNERVTQNFTSVLGMNKYYLVKNLLLSTATPHIDLTNGVMTSPRKQGAGVMNLAGATKSNVIVVDPESGVSKINKKDVGNNFTLNAVVKNLGKEPATFTYSTTVQTDSVTKGHMDLKPRLLKTIPGSTITVPAESELPITVNVDASEFEAELSNLMPNGYFLEGFISFKSEKESDLNIAYIGFHGKWNDIPVLEKSIYDLTAEGKLPFYYTKDTMNFTHFFSKLGTDRIVLGYNADEEVKYNKEKIVISPNGDNKADDLSLNGTFLRNYKNVQLSVFTPGTEVPIFKSYISSVFGTGNKNHFSMDEKKWPKSTTSSSWNWNGKVNYNVVEDGIYEIQVSSTPDIPNGTPQIQKYNVMVDTKAPQVKEVSFNPETGVLKFTAFDLTSGIKSVKVSLPDGTEVAMNEDGSYTLPKGIDETTVLIVIEDYGYNVLKDSAKNIQIPNKNASIQVRAEATDGGIIPSYTPVVKNEKGEIQLNIDKLAYGTYTVEATNIKSGFVCENPTHTVTLTEASPSAKVTFKFHELKIPTQELVVDVNVNGGTYPNEIQVIATDSQGKVYPLAADTIIKGWYAAKLPYETYTVTIKDVAENWMVTPDKLIVTVADKTLDVMTMNLNYGAGGHIRPVAVSNDNLDLSKVTFEAYDYYGNPVNLGEKLAYGEYTIYPINLPEGTYAEPQFMDVELKDGANELKPEFKIIDARGIYGSIKVNTIKAKDYYTDLNPSYEVIDFYGNKVTDLNKMPLGTYFVKPTNVHMAYTYSPESTMVVLNKENLSKEISFTFTKLSETGKMGVLYFWVTTPFEYRDNIIFEVTAEDGTVTTFESDKTRPFSNKLDLKMGVYTIKAKNIAEGFYLEPETLTVAVASGFTDAKFVLKKGERPAVKIATIEPSKDIEVAFGTKAEELVLPTTVSAVLDNGTKVELPVTWDKAAFTENKVGTFTLNGTVDLTNNTKIVNSNNVKATVNVIVKAKEITSVTELEALKYGLNVPFEKLSLPKEVEVILSNGEKVMLPVIWDGSTYNSEKASTQTIKGTIVLPEDGTIENTAEIKPSIVVEVVRPLTIRVTDITKVAKVPYGTAEMQFELPKTTTVLLSNLTLKEMNVTWKKVSYTSFGAAGAYYLYVGTIDLPEDGTIVNPLSLKALYTVSVQHKNASKFKWWKN